VYAALRSLGRRGLEELIDRCCDHAELMASRLREAEGIEVLNDVVLNQITLRFFDDDDVTNSVIERVQDDGTCWLGGSTFKGRAVMRISIVGWQTSADDVERSASAILAAARAAAPV
jgi:glutamate/tyrosine decarboxylase-like PLP-dependent enzyme